MKATDKSTLPLWANTEQIEKLRKELHVRLSQVGPDYSWRLEALADILRVDPITVHLSWIKPLLAAGLSLEAAITCIAESQFLPN